MDAVRLQVVYDGAGPVHWNGRPGAFGLQDKDKVLHPGTPGASRAVVDGKLLKATLVDRHPRATSTGANIGGTRQVGWALA